MNNSKTLLSSLALTAFAASFSLTPVEGAGYKCYGISAPGENSCEALDHKEHTCGGYSTRNKHPGDWQVTADEAECKTKGGFSEAEARQKLGMPPADA